MKKLFLSILIVFSTTLLFAQQKSDPKAKAIVDKTASRLKGKSYQTDITITNSAQETVPNSAQKISVKVDKDKFYMVVADNEIFFDGKTQWLYSKELNEVTISEPTNEELSQIAPTLFIKNYSKNYRVLFDSEKKSDKYYIINFFPNSKSEDIFRIRFYILKDLYAISSVETSFRNGEKITLSFSAFGNITPNDNMFRFPESKYPKAIINDLR